MDQHLILNMLMESEYVTEADISQKLGIPLANVQKNLKALLSQGVQIAPVNQCTYRLIPPDDAVWPVSIQKFLSTRWAGQQIEYHPVIDSTNFRARSLALKNAPHGTLIVADQQTSGRGRMTRNWIAEPCSSILMSLLLRPENLSPAKATGLVLMAALAVCMACRDEGADVKIKWPNDLVANGKKLCGMLLDMNADMERVHYAIVGVGINISSFPSSDDLRHASCLQDACGHSVARAQVIARFLSYFEKLYDRWCIEGISSLLPTYRKHSVTLFNRVRVISLSETFEATAIDVLEDGSLLTQLDTGECITVHAGDVSVRGIMDYV